MITVREATTKRDINRFFTFPIELYKDNPYYVPGLIYDEKGTFNKKKNPVYEHAESILFLAERDGEVVGRAAGIINHKLNEHQGIKDVRLSRYDIIDDLEVSRALIDKVTEWGKSKGMTRMIGPMGFSDLDKQGLLIEGFDQLGMFITLYNHPYYKDHLEALGFEKEVDWVEFKIFTPEYLDPKIERVTEIAMKRNGYKLLTFEKKKDAIPYARRAFYMYNEAFAKIYGFYPQTDAQIEALIDEFIMIVTAEYFFIVTDKDDEVIGFGLMVPSLSEAVQKSKGRLFPTGLLRIKKALKQHSILDMYLIAVKPEYLGRGVNALILNAGIKKAMESGASFAETGPELEDNMNVQTQWKTFKTEQHKRRRCYKKDI